MELVATIAAKGFRFGVVIAALGFGFRHGIDWDHIAAITDITSSQDERRRSMLFGTLYALGHALVVLVLGIVAILAGERLPDSVDKVMTRIVGVTLLLLGVYVFASLIRHGRDFRMRSRWMLIFAGVRRGVRWIRRRRWAAGDPTTVGRGGVTTMTLGDDETPTQVLVFLAAAGAGGRTAGVIVLVAFIVGLLSSNSLITLGSTFGFLRASKNFPIYATVAVLTGTFSLVIGSIFLLGKTTVLPALFGG